MSDDATLTLAIGSLIADRYRVLGHLGSGGMGAVYRVEHTAMAKQLALKLLRPELCTQTAVAERFEREARSAASLDHPAIVRVTDFGTRDDGGLFMVMEWVDGPSLAERLAAGGAMPADAALALVDQLLGALEHAHGHGVIHRDIKPANVMLARGPNGGEQAKLVDFGIAKIVGAEGTEPTLTQVGAVMGTPRYMSPEQAAGEPVDARSDLYSVGVVLYELLQGKPPFTGASVEVMSKHMTQAPPPLKLDTLPAARAHTIEALVLRALAKRREDRFADAAAFRAAIAQLATSVAAPPWAGLVRRADLFRRTRPQWVRGLGVVAVIVVLAAALHRSGPDTGTLVGQGEAALARGDLPAARAIVIEALAQATPTARAHLLQAGIALAESHADDALSALRRAVELDHELLHDPWVETAVRTEVERDSKTAPAFLALITEQGTSESAPLLAELARSAQRSALRKEAFIGLERLNATARLDALTWLLDELKGAAGQSCTARKWYVERIIARSDVRALPALKKELGRKGGFLNLSSLSDCMASELRAHIKELEPPKAKAE